jgi:hypothetical protein
MDSEKKPAPPPKWKQKSSKRFDSYAKAKEFFDTLPVFRETNDGKKRIKARKSGHFDVLVFEPAPQPKKEPEEQAA